jgi:hypothetical protein
MKLSTFLAGVALAALAASVAAHAVSRDPINDAVAVRPVPGAAAFPVSDSAAAVKVSEVICGATATDVAYALTGHRAVEFFNGGPNSVFFRDGTAAANAATADTRSREVKSGSSWALDLSDSAPMNCIAKTAAQLTGAATTLTEAK